MPRTLIAAAVGLAGFTAYVAAVITLADYVWPLHWAVHALYFLVAGVLWAVPARWLMIWAYRKPTGPS